MAKKHKIPGMRAERIAPPLCSIHRTPTQKNDAGEWYCRSCFEEWAKAHLKIKGHGKSLGGLELPAGVQDERLTETIDGMQFVLPNRRQRRAMGVR